MGRISKAFRGAKGNGIASGLIGDTEALNWKAESETGFICTDKGNGCSVIYHYVPWETRPQAPRWFLTTFIQSVLHSGPLSSPFNFHPDLISS